MTRTPIAQAASRQLEGLVALVTGGSSGIGAAIVRALHHAGASVFFTYLTQEARARALASELGDRIAFARCDLADHDRLPEVVARCVAEFARIDVLVNNAAVYAENPFESTSYNSWRNGWQHTFDVNVFGAAHLAWLVMPQMRRQGGGRIINVASRAGHRGELRCADYGASKAALINLTKSIARACARDGIVAMAVAPGFIETEMARADLVARRSEIESEIPLGRLGSPEEVAHIVAFLASPLAQHVNGATVDVNGGSYVR